MIASVEGRIRAVTKDALVVDIGGVGLRVPVHAAHAGRRALGRRDFLHTHLVVREDDLTLVGFAAGRSWGCSRA